MAEAEKWAGQRLLHACGLPACCPGNIRYHTEHALFIGNLPPSPTPDDSVSQNILGASIFKTLENLRANNIVFNYTPQLYFNVQPTDRAIWS
jgi:hypothetical protein